MIAEIRDQYITETIETNYMPYVMTVIVSRAIPEIDGFKPSHRKLLYTMYKLGLMEGGFMKCAKVCGSAMHYNPHGDASIYATLVRLTEDHEALLHPFIASKGTFGKQYSRDTVPAASRYTECKLSPICKEIFGGINKDAVDMVDNFDATAKEPTLLPTAFPNILVSPNLGVAVSMATNICSFNLGEICDGTVELLKNPRVSSDRLLDIIKGPDFPVGGQLVYNREKMCEIYETGSGSFRLRSVYKYDKSNNCIDITEIPYSTSVEQIMDDIAKGIKDGTIKELSDMRDETDFGGLKLTLDLRKGVDPDKLMVKLFKLTSLEDRFNCNFNIIVKNQPKQLGVRDILLEWIDFRVNCVRRELMFDLNAKKDKLHLLLGLGKILLDIDRAIAIVRGTEKEADVVPNLAKEFGLTTVQAEYVAEIKLRYLNREYIINRVKEISSLQAEIADLEATVASEKRLKNVIAKQLQAIKEKYGKPRKTEIIPETGVQEYVKEEYVETETVKIFFTKEGYFKRCLPSSLRVADTQLLKDGDSIIFSEETDSGKELIFFSDRCKLYRAKISQFSNMKASQLGDYVPSKLGFEDGEKAVYMQIAENLKPEDNFIFIFENGKGVKVPISAYDTKSARKKLTGAYSAASPLVAVFTENKPFNILLVSDAKRGALISTKLIPVKTTRTASGVTLMNLKKDQKLSAAQSEDATAYKNPSKYRKIKIPATGTLIDEYDIEVNQISMLDDSDK